MSKINRHRVNANIINSNQENNIESKYINDELTFNNRRLLWLFKIKSKEQNWKFVLICKGNIFARKNENSPFFTIRNTADIENINKTINSILFPLKNSCQ